MTECHTLFDGKVHLYRRKGSRYWQCAVFLGQRNHRQSTRELNIAYAMAFARDWYLDLEAEQRLIRRGITPPPRPVVPEPAVAASRKASGVTFQQAADAFLREYHALAGADRNPEYVKSKERALRTHLLPFFGGLTVAEVTAGRIQDYRVARQEPPATPQAKVYSHKGRTLRGRPPAWKRPSRSTLHKELVVLRQVLKTASRQGWIAGIPDMTTPYRASGKISHRAWFSPAEFKIFFEAVSKRAKTPKRDRWRGECEQFRDYVAFMVNTGLRPDEASRIEHRDISILIDEDTTEEILVIEVRGKRGVGFCKSMPEAVAPYRRVLTRTKGKPTDLVFGAVQRELMNAILNEVGLKQDREGNARTAYSLRHTYICFRLMEGADIYQLAKNCRTSVEMIEKFYAAHLKNAVDASAINVRKAAPATTPLPAKRPR
ncbi:MAG: site-specific integrase [Alphaproteobacteria bacterium]|nr:site-specific integrase [Alphaproteobacteria bacterium]MBU1515645.1 site-specific integrase [Alphaproteobacteria bacterium]MBU2094904.1 site-specific integrase [Alphaproteobacteria bacterium]MBU2150936.1 site-specific integrase [Alphaproteobacteria bacterium]MBU2305913.1 site-specific integrase [Alphaproteobacteria bacterium]